MTAVTKIRTDEVALRKARMLSSGKWVDSASGEVLKVEDPAHRRPIAEVPRGGVSFLAAADERQVFCVNRKRRQQRSFITAPLRRDHDIAFAGFLDRQCIAFDAPINVVERRLLDWWCADGHSKTHPLCKIGDCNGHRARSTNNDRGAWQHGLEKYVHRALVGAYVLGKAHAPFLLAGLVAVLIQLIGRLDRDEGGSAIGKRILGRFDNRCPSAPTADPAL